MAVAGTRLIHSIPSKSNFPMHENSFELERNSILLYIWHKFIQPIMLKYWNPWEKKDEQGNVIKAAPEFPFQCKGGVCPFPGASKKAVTESEGSTANDSSTAASTSQSSSSSAAAVSTDDSKKEN
ncbi:UPF0729 protein CG18508 [Episyrphus balteatus]|uniref:UPF0729 protein CG18508 n=1 Tax=Episyrphus balteatus TaxID=286459 RepID=UPI002484F5A0|nr:UPF0729 protein CG18508 [Episyrphus balteatus]XP_055841290.1 UPF0729 protein CG18508 [Episyrphus balteatus]